MNKDWIITIGIDKFFVTEKQKDFYLQAITAGNKYVVLDDTKVLGTNFQTIVHISEKDITKQLESGKWQCEKGKFHAKESICTCGKQYVQGENGNFYLAEVNENNQLESGE